MTAMSRGLMSCSMDRSNMHVQRRHSVRENVCTIIIREHYCFLSHMNNSVCVVVCHVSVHMCECPLEAIEEWSGQQTAGEGLEGEGQPVLCSPPGANLHISCNLRGTIWVRIIGMAQQMHAL